MNIKTLFVAIVLGATQLGWATVVDPTCLETLDPRCLEVPEHFMATNAIYADEVGSIECGVILAGGPNTKFDHVAQMPSIQYDGIV